METSVLQSCLGSPRLSRVLSTGIYVLLVSSLAGALVFLLLPVLWKGYSCTLHDDQIHQIGSAQVSAVIIETGGYQYWLEGMNGGLGSVLNTRWL